ncbi:hypothetical protein AVEN_164372-1 [Araneus ventricosus]|uniref:C2H2-type domain-containing protein n=1 Tax=Araneus ventricosus TaxID=182803 RepID=A0A4Y2GD36_ARAVE|nr:hypothetical protein AVEN_164372-1 [Araneus ventricosus]
MVWREKNEELNPKNLVGTIKYCGGGALVWGCMSASGLDNDPKHTPLNVRLWCLYNCPQNLKTPPQSPDLNPIEHIWRELEMDICPGPEEPIILEHLHLEPGKPDTDDSELRTSYETHIIEGHTVHRCMVCQYRSSIITNMKRHVRTHTGSKPFSCPHCGQRFARKENAIRHIRTIHVT